MAKPVNLIRNVNGVLITKNVNFFGKRWAVQDGADGYSSIDVVVTDTTQDVKLYLEGSNDITVFPVASDVSKLCKSALTSFPKINTIFLFSTTKVNIEEQTKGLGDYLSYLSLLSKIYVPSALLNNYQSSYASLSSKFDIIVEDLTITIEWVGNNALTSEEITRQLNMLESAYLNQATKLVIDDRYTDYLDTLWAYNFTEKCSALNNNIWHGTDKIDLTSKTLSGSDELLESDITNLINGISSDKINGVTQLKFSGFSDMSVALTYDYSALTNLEYVWLDNVRYQKIVAPSGYEWVEYVENDNNCGFEITTTLSNNSEIELEYYDNLTFSSNGMIFNSLNNRVAIGTIAGTWEVCSWNTNPSRVRGKLIRNNKYKLSVSKNGVYANSSKIIDVSEQTFEYTNISLFLFGTSQYWFPLNNVTYGYGKIYNFVKKENGVLDLDLRPIKNLNTSEYCIYDLISNTIYSKSGSGVMTGGSKANQWNIPTYFYPIADLVQDYDARYTQTFYLDYNGTLPTLSSDFTYTWYSDINCTTTILPENMVSGNRYYAKAVMVTLSIRGSGTLTSAIVELQVAKACSGVTKVVIPSSFSDWDNNCLDTLDNYFSSKQLTLEINNNPPKKLNLVYTNIDNSSLTVFSDLSIKNTASISILNIIGTFVNIYLNEGTILQETFSNSISITATNVYGDNITTINGFGLGWSNQITNIYFPKITQFYSLSRDGNVENIFIGTDNCSLVGYAGNIKIGYLTNFNGNLYIPAKDIVNYKNGNWAINYSSKIVGVLDGNSIYTDKGFSYPTLTGIDTEANIQLLTPADNALYLASDTGNLWQYDSANSQWVNLFVNLTGISWYSDEDCTTSVLPSAMDTTHTYYVKASGTRGYNFASDSWDNIKYCLDNDIAHYNLGDTKTITYNNTTYTIRICDLGGRYDITNGNGAKNKATFEFVELVGTGQMNTTGTSNGGFASSLMHTTTLPNIYNNLPNDLKTVISQVSVASASDGSVSGSGSLSYSDNYLFLANTYEIIGNRYVGNSLEETTQYGLYSLNNTNSFRAKSPVGGSAIQWWLRSPMSNNATAFNLINSGGSAGYTNAIGYQGISPFFCI